MVNNVDPYHKGIKRQKTAKKDNVGTYYHPTEKTYRDGKCPEGMVTKRGYYRHAYDKKDGKHVKHTYVHESCVPNKGIPGKIFDNMKPIHLDEKNSFKSYNYKTSNDPEIRFKKLLKAAEDLSYRSVVLRLSQLKTLTKDSNHEHSLIYDEDIMKLREWRKKNPNVYKNKKVNSKEINSEEVNPEEVKSEEVKPEEVNSEEVKHERSKSRRSKSRRSESRRSKSRMSETRMSESQIGKGGVKKYTIDM